VFLVAQPTDGQETALQHHVATAATNVWSEGDPRDADANESWTAFQQRTAPGGNQRPEAATVASPMSSCRTRRTVRNRAVRQTAVTKPSQQQRVQLSSDNGDDRV